MERFTFDVTLYPQHDGDCEPERTLKCKITAPNRFEARQSIMRRAHLDGKFVRRLDLIGKKAMR